MKFTAVEIIPEPNVAEYLSRFQKKTILINKRIHRHEYLRQSKTVHSIFCKYQRQSICGSKKASTAISFLHSIPPIAVPPIKNQEASGSNFHNWKRNKSGATQNVQKRRDIN